ncbi:MAG: hypothetical protein R2873_14170 [Caldilineaceae bacterium]
MSGGLDQIGIPILGSIVAGYPIEVVPADRETAEDWIELNRSFFRRPEELYAALRTGRFHDRRQRPRR